jgi:hypothetical protein
MRAKQNEIEPPVLTVTTLHSPKVVPTKKKEEKKKKKRKKRNCDNTTSVKA